MYIVVRKSDNMIVLTATKEVGESQYDSETYDIYMVNRNEFSKDMVGKKIISFEEDV